MDLSDPKNFFQVLIASSYEDWKQDLRSEHKLRSLCVFMDSLAEIIVVRNGKNKKKYKDNLVNNCPAFRLVWDVADSTKHSNLNRPNARFKRIGQLYEKQFDTVDEFPIWDEMTDFDSGSMWFIQDDNGKSEKVIESIEAVYKMWEKEVT